MTSLLNECNTYYAEKSVRVPQMMVSNWDMNATLISPNL